MSDYFIKQKNNKNGEGTTFLVKILFRQNYSWQGNIFWIENGRSLHFRSFLELVTLMQEAMEKSCTPGVEYDLRTWNKKPLNTKNSTIQRKL